MKNILLLFLYAPTIVCMSSCTKNFEKDNTDPSAATQEQLEQDYQNISGFITQMEQGIVPLRHNNTDDLNQYQLMYDLCGNNYSGQQGPSNDFGGNQNGNTYKLASNSWSTALFTNSYLKVMSPWATIKVKAAIIAPYAVAVAQILKVLAMDQVTDAYGPIPYSRFSIGALTVPYDSQDTVYYTFFNELDSAIAILNRYIQNSPGLTPLANIDIIYKSDFAKWLKLANSIKLRLALRIVYADPVTAQAQAESAVLGGVITENSDNALVPVDGTILWNPLQQTCYNYNDTRMGATMESFLKGYKDPRAPLLFNKVAVPAGSVSDYHGIRTGINVNRDAYVNFSTMNIQVSTPVQFMAAPEVYFLRAEGALRGWDMGASAQDLYETGVKTSFSQPIGGGNTGAGDATAYLADDTSKPAPYIDPITSGYSIFTGDLNLSIITIKWDPTAAFETSLERIITQKWIALFPQGLEAWAEFRRTGYPKVFPVAVNNSGGLVSTQTQIRRLPYPQSEYDGNSANVTQGVKLLTQEALSAASVKGDNGGTRLWWDRNANH